MIVLSHSTKDILAFSSVHTVTSSYGDPLSLISLPFRRQQQEGRDNNHILLRGGVGLRRVLSWSRRFSSNRHDDDDDDMDTTNQVEGDDHARIGSLKSENSKLRDTIRQLEAENETLKKRARRGMVGLEQFEGERFFSASSTFPDEMDTLGGLYRRSSVFSGDDEMVQENDLWCDDLNQGKFSLLPQIRNKYEMRRWIISFMLSYRNRLSCVPLVRRMSTGANHFFQPSSQGSSLLVGWSIANAVILRDHFKSK